MTSSNFPLDSAGRVYHLSVKPGEVANRIVTVGDPARLRRFAVYLDASPKQFEVVSSRGFTIVTGRYKGVPVSLIAIGMGQPNMDFMVREVRAIVTGDLAIIRFGSCGSLDSTLKPGAIGAPREVMTIMTNYDYWSGIGSGQERTSEGAGGYTFSKPIPADPILHEALLESLLTSVSSPSCEIRDIALHASADCFYSSQGRQDPNFNDDNETLISDLLQKYPTLSSLEMETAHLFHLARISTLKGKISASAAHMIFASRTGEDFIDPAVVEKLEPLVGKACLEAVIGFHIDDDKLHPEQGSVWQL